MLVAPSLSQIHSRFTHKHEAFHISRASHFENVFGKQTTEDLYDSGSENDSGISTSDAFQNCRFG